MNRFIRSADGLAAAFMFVVALSTLIAVVGRKFFGWSPPDYFDIARLLLGIAIFWGIASACYRNGHILVDIVYEMAKPARRRAIDLVATAILAAFMGALAWAAIEGVLGTRSGNVQTAELRLPVWIFHAIAAIGAVTGFVLACVRLARLARGEDTARTGIAPE